MSEIVLSTFLSVIFEKLASAALEKLAPYNEITSEIKKLQLSLFQIRDVLADASHKEITDQSVKRWLNSLQHLAYDIDDVLDELATEAMHRELNDEAGSHTSKVIKFLSTPFSKHSSWNRRMMGKINDITTKLQDLIEEKDALGLIVKEETRSKDINRRLQTSVVDPSGIVGRQDEKEALIQQLFSPVDETCDQNYSIVPILGMGGVGKTTLARLLYDDQQVKDHFQLKAWVCVSDEFDSFGISKVIFQAVAGINKKFADLNLLQEELRTILREKRFLLVLDDVWTEKYADWETLVQPFYTCASGSKIIITTRKDQLLKQLVHNPLIEQLSSLSNDDALSLFALHALGVPNFDSHLVLKPYAEGVVKNCGGLPLTLIAIGRLLRTKRKEVEHWKEVSNSEIWTLKDEGGILAALRLSYHDLSATLKRLFAYCSLFPKDFLFDKEELILLWMAEGLLHQPSRSDSTEERLGHKLFDELLSRSFFQQAPNNESLFVMHDLKNDLATSIAAEFFLRLDNESEKNVRVEMLERHRHISFVREKYVAYKKFEAFESAKSLRTFLATSVGEVESWGGCYLSNKILTNLLPKLPLLRVLCLSNFYISEVPESIGTLRHLRYLNLSRTRITHLPESVCNLYNLQSLILFGCGELSKLPNSFLKLKNLRHLDVRKTELLFQILLGLSELESLQITLSNILIGSENGSELAKLKDFMNLCGNISISGLEKVQNAIHACVANFSQRRLTGLELVWSDELYDSRNEMLEKEVLNELKPCHDNLIKLKIRSYGGLEFPNWVGAPFFLHLKHVSISGCKRCKSLPPLAQLPSLKELFVKGLYGVEALGFDLCADGHAFPSLEILTFVDMRGWKKWSGVVLPCLQNLTIHDCPNLVEVTLEALPSLNVLDISDCDSVVLRRLVETTLTITKLEIRRITGLNSVVWRGVIEYLVVVEELRISECNEIRYMWESDAIASKVLVNLRKLDVSHCEKLVSLGKKEENKCRSNLLASLRTLKVYNCENMEHCSCPGGIEELDVGGCGSITVVSFPSGGLENLRSLQFVNCMKLLDTELGGQKMNNKSSMPMLEYLWISGSPNLKSVIELNRLVHLTTLYIHNCESLESFPDNLTSLKHLQIYNCPSMDASFPGWVWPPNLCSLGIGKLKKPISEWGPQNFPTSLVELDLIGDDGVSSSSHFSHLLPPPLTSLGIYKFGNLESFSLELQHLKNLQHLVFANCPSLKKVWDPQHLTFLHHLSFVHCPNMMDLSECLLPSLLRLEIRGDCPNLKERCSKNGSYWPLISHIPCIDMY